MVDFNMEIAGVAMQIHALHESSRRYCRKYLTDCQPEFSIAITAEDLILEREKTEQTDRAEGNPVRQVTDARLEITAIQRKIAQKLVEYDTVLFHGSVIAVDGVAYLFTAKSGTGKSTHTRLWREMFGQRAVMVNDDKPFLRVSDQGILACGSPWNGKHHLGNNMQVPLKGICLLERGAENQIAPMDAQKALAVLLQQSNRPAGAKMLAKYLELMDQIVASVPIYRLRCNMEPEAAAVAYQGMANKLAFSVEK